MVATTAKYLTFPNRIPVVCSFVCLLSSFPCNFDLQVAFGCVFCLLKSSHHTRSHITLHLAFQMYLYVAKRRNNYNSKAPTPKKSATSNKIFRPNKNDPCFCWRFDVKKIKTKSSDPKCSTNQYPIVDMVVSRVWYKQKQIRRQRETDRQT